LFEAKVRERARALAAAGGRPERSAGVELTRIARTGESDRIHYEHVTVDIDRGRRLAKVIVRGPRRPPPMTIDAITTAGARWWPLAMARELDDAILSLRTNEAEVGTWLLLTEGDPQAVLAADTALLDHRDHWLVRETVGLLRRTLARLEVSSRSLLALIEPGSCFVGTLLELALAADRSYMLAGQGSGAPRILVNDVNFGLYPLVSGVDRLQARFYGELEPLRAIRAAAGKALGAAEALALGLVTAAPDELDWPDEVRLAVEERAALSPDALTGMEASLRFGGRETLETRIFGRLSAWQNWIFNRPNAVGEKGALKVYGKGERAQFDFERV
jgi:benzoyl-CoA-dihydrodiol lyase